MLHVHRYTQLVLEEIKNRDRKEKASTDSVCPKEHFKDKPVDVSCGKTDKTQSGTGDAEKRELTNERVPGKSEER